MTDEEAVAKVIFTHWQFQRSCPGGQFLWVDGGNSHKQDEARDFARAAIADARDDRRWLENHSPRTAYGKSVRKSWTGTS
jgi:hypothetical protein